jgi:hypothetical protein
MRNRVLIGIVRVTRRQALAVDLKVWLAGKWCDISFGVRSRGRGLGIDKSFEAHQEDIHS